jgi:glycine cleavage system H protein
VEEKRYNSRKSPSRREFLKSLGLAMGGTTLASIIPTAACGRENISTTIPPSKTDTVSTSTSSSATQNVPPSTSSATAMNLLEVPGTTVKVAADRLYSIEHIWVKPMSDNEVRLGITDKIQALMEAVKSISIPKSGAVIGQGDAFGFIEGYKMNMDLISPLSGTVLTTNPEMANVKETEYGPLNLDPYGKGWILAVSPSRPEELKSLLSVEAYIALTAGTKTAA